MPRNFSTPEELMEALLQLSPEELKQQDHASLYQAREHAPKDKATQNKLAAAEHRAFAREATAENPLMAVPIALASILYQPYKAVMGKSRSESGLGQALEGLTGVGEGLSQRVQGALKL